MSSELIERAVGDHDEDGFYLEVDTDEGEHRFRVASVATARELLSAVNKLRPWISEHDAARADYDAATPEERARVIGGGMPLAEPQFEIERERETRDGQD